MEDLDIFLRLLEEFKMDCFVMSFLRSAMEAITSSLENFCWAFSPDGLPWLLGSGFEKFLALAPRFLERSKLSGVS